MKSALFILFLASASAFAGGANPPLDAEAFKGSYNLKPSTSLSNCPEKITITPGYAEGGALYTFDVSPIWTFRDINLGWQSEPTNVGAFLDVRTGTPFTTQITYVEKYQTIKGSDDVGYAETDLKVTLLKKEIWVQGHKYGANIACAYLR